MLPKLPDTDLFSQIPDAEGIDLWAEDFTWDLIPSAYGCYAFYDDNTAEVLYVGSACAFSNDASQKGLRMRLRFYRGRGPKQRVTSTIEKVRAERARRTLLLRCWITGSIGDARKYEHDALEKHKPTLNWIGTRQITQKAHRQRKQEWLKNYKRKRRVYDPKAPKRCPKCKMTKECGAFHRSSYTRMGVKSQCKTCRNKSQ